MDIAHLKQSVDMRSDMFSPLVVTPYSTRMPRQSEDPEMRLFFGDTQEDVENKVRESTPTTDYIWTMDDTAGVVLNPIVEKSIYAIESARAMGNQAPHLKGLPLRDGKGVVDFARNPTNLLMLREALPELVYRFIIEPFGGNKDGR